MVDQDAQASPGQLAAPEARQLDAVVPLKVGLYGVGVVADQGDERGQFPAPPAS
ncbi:hypothetical protein [Micromonospora sp. WMMD980]|uniref:hypothetical protein n=1 Tax=Micromonospora sp. WMMD980 TaxID=3016088 RepID=UPI002417FBEB|nr:hypothetical protein [Micromonospora sp. WMMD980]MDG4801722.1 hypothetical protein [Micromonospora sp. WMMD980]